MLKQYILTIFFVQSLPGNEEQLHRAQMEVLPSRQALTELEMWLEQLEIALREDEGRTLTNMMDVQMMLQKYKVNKYHLNNPTYLANS